MIDELSFCSSESETRAVIQKSVCITLTYSVSFWGLPFSGRVVLKCVMARLMEMSTSTSFLGSFYSTST